MKRFGGALIAPLAAALLALAIYGTFVGRPVVRAQENANGTWAAVRLESYPEEDAHYVMLVSPQGKIEVIRWARKASAIPGEQNPVTIVGTLNQPVAPQP